MNLKCKAAHARDSFLKKIICSLVLFRAQTYWAYLNSTTRKKSGAGGEKRCNTAAANTYSYTYILLCMQFCVAYTRELCMQHSSSRVKIAPQNVKVCLASWRNHLHLSSTVISTTQLNPHWPRQMHRCPLLVGGKCHSRIVPWAWKNNNHPTYSDRAPKWSL